MNAFKHSNGPMHNCARTREVAGVRVVVGSDLLDLVRCHHDQLISAYSPTRTDTKHGQTALASAR